MGATKRVVVTDHTFEDVALERAAARRLNASLEVAACVTEADVIEATRGADVLLVNLAPITDSVLSGLAPGAVIIRYGVGYDNVDVDVARRLGMKIANIPAYGADTVADHALALMLTMIRRIPEYTSATRMGAWPTPREFGPVQGLRSVTVGLIGTGRIGLAFADRLRPLGVRIVAFDPFVEPAFLTAKGIRQVQLPQLLQSSGVVSLHLPLTSQTQNFVDERAIGMMRPEAILINTARGGLVDDEALADALREGRIAGAALDVLSTEPPTDSPLSSLANVIVTPHVGFYSEESLQRLQAEAAAELGRALVGEPLLGRVV